MHKTSLVSWICVFVYFFCKRKKQITQIRRRRIVLFFFGLNVTGRMFGKKMIFSFQNFCFEGRKPCKPV